VHDDPIHRCRCIHQIEAEISTHISHCCRTDPSTAANSTVSTTTVDFGKLIELEFGILAQLFALAREIRLFGIGLRTDGHIFACGHRHGASHQSRDTPAINMSFCVASAAATPTIKLAVERMPSLVPSTAALDHPMRLTK
jgi:hypothetical protein